MNLALVLAFDRPELLQLCLERIGEAEKPPGFKLRVVIDRAGGFLQRECRRVADSFDVEDVVERPQHTFPGNSSAVLESLRDSGAERVFLIEEDVLVAPDFFLWHERVQRQTGCFASVAWRNVRRAAPAATGDFWLSSLDYSSVGVSWPAASLASILEHASRDYYRAPARYVEGRFPHSPFGKEFPEQDGLIIRVMGEQGGACAFSLPQRCWHVGWYGYHRPLARPRGTLEQRIAFVREAVESGSFAGIEVDCFPFKSFQGE